MSKSEREVTDANKYIRTSRVCSASTFIQAPTPSLAASTVPVLASLFALDILTRHGAEGDQRLRPEAGVRFGPVRRRNGVGPIASYGILKLVGRVMLSMTVLDAR